MYKIRKLFKLEFAHCLSSCYSDECKNVHGHSYKIEIIINSLSLNEDGMVIDFKKLKEIVNRIILSKFDHSLVLHNTPEMNKMVTALVGQNVIVADYNPTAENMAKAFHEKLAPVLAGIIRGFTSLEVIIHETDTGYASYI